MPIPQDQVTLLSYFETGDKPTQAQYTELIETMFWLYQDAKDKAQQAADDAAEALSHAPQAMVAAHYVSGTSYTIDAQSNIASVTTRRISDSGLDNVGNIKLRFAFTTPMADALYVALLTPLSGSQNWDRVSLVTKTVDYVELVVGNPSGGTIHPDRVELIVFHP